jgi:hypothetical protein
MKPGVRYIESFDWSVSAPVGAYEFLNRPYQPLKPMTDEEKIARARAKRRRKGRSTEMKARLIQNAILSNDTRLTWYCPGCKCHHEVPVPPHPQAWEWNGSLSAPTLSPSVMVTSGHYIAGHQGKCWCDITGPSGTPKDFLCSRCHCFVRDGRIEFLGDCSHDHAGQTVDMQDLY